MSYFVGIYGLMILTQGPSFLNFVNWQNIIVFLYRNFYVVFPLTTLDKEVGPRVLATYSYIYNITPIFCMTMSLNMLIWKEENICSLPLWNRMQHNWGFQRSSKVNQQRTSYIFFRIVFSMLLRELSKVKLIMYVTLTSSHDTDAFFMIDDKRLDKYEHCNHT